MQSDELGIFGWGLYLPPVHSISEVIKSAGGDPTDYLKFGWPNICIAESEDFPDGMCTKALKDALKNAHILSEQLDFVICTSTTHDFLEVPTSTEVMRNIGVKSTCVGFDIYQGCLTTLTVLEIAKLWLSGRGGGYGAIITGERWAETIDKSDKEVESLWGFSDGGSALIVGVNVPERPKVVYGGSVFFTNNEMSGHNKKKFGGARFPVVLKGESPIKRLVRPLEPEKLNQLFFEGYGKVIAEFKSRFKEVGDWIVCNQGTPGTLETIGFLADIDLEKIVQTGDQWGHLGCSDIIIGLNKLEGQNKLVGRGMALCSNPGAWGAGYLEVKP